MFLVQVIADLFLCVFCAGYGDICPMGYHCPLGSELPVECPAGKYQNEIGQSVCKTCPEGEGPANPNKHNGYGRV